MVAKLTPAQRQHLRKYGTMPDEQATTLEQIMYRACVSRRLNEFYREGDKDYQHMMRVMIRSFAVTLVWKQNPDSPVTVEQVKAMEKEFMRRAKDDPPF